MAFLGFPSTGSSYQGNSQGKYLPFLQQPSTKKQVLLLAPLPGAAGQRQRQAANPHLSPRQVHSPAGWRLSKPAAGLGEAPEWCRCAGTTRPSLPGQDLAAHPSWKVAHFLPAGGEGVPEPGSSSQAAGKRKPAARLAALGKI